MTIPDLGHCAGSGSAPIEGTVDEEDGRRSGVCGACSRRFELDADGSLSFHHSIAEEASQEERREGDPGSGPG